MLRLEKAQVTALGAGAAAVPEALQRQVRLSEEDKAELVARYRAGALQRELAESYGIERRTAMKIISRHKAVERYDRGDSLATIGDALGVAANTVRQHLMER